MLTSVENYTDYQKISNSELYLLNRCKKAHEYSYYQGLVAKNTPDYFTKGSFFHLLMAEILRNTSTMTVDGIAELSRQIQAKQIKDGDPSVDEGVRNEVVAQVMDFWQDIGFPDSDKVVAVEEEFYADLGWVDNDSDPVMFHGFIDAVVRDDDDNLWIIEHKTAGRAWSQSQFQFSYQGKLYAEAWEILTGERPIGIQYNFFYPKRWEIRQQYISTEESRLLLNEVQASVFLRDMITDSGFHPREPKWGCGDCRFRNLCFAELQGTDAGYIRQTEYTVDPERMREDHA